MALPKSESFLKSCLESHQFSGAAMYMRNPVQEQAIYCGSHYKKDLDLGIENLAVTRASIFDMASLTKILSTVQLLFCAEQENLITWKDPVQRYFPEFPSSTTTLYDLAVHQSGLPSHIEFFRRYFDGEAKMGDQSVLVDWICACELQRLGVQNYSDLGFILLGFVLEQVYGKTIPEIFFEKIATPLKLESSGFVVLPHALPAARMRSFLAEPKRFVVTEKCPWRKKYMQGEVHDDNTWAMGGYAGHAGLFSTTHETAKLFMALYHKARGSKGFLSRKTEAPGVFSYGFMTYPGLRPSPGPFFERSLGHTGFVGTSIWFHEVSETLVVLFTNRVHPSRADDRWIQSRLDFHKILWNEVGYEPDQRAI